jgi:hypothetical protein
VKRDNQRAGAGLVLLGIFAGVGTGLLACTGMWQGASSGGDTGSILLVCAAVFLVLLVVGLFLRFGSRNPTARGAGRVLTTGLVSAGITIASTAVVVLVIIVVAVLVAVMAFAAFVGQVCHQIGGH